MTSQRSKFFYKCQSYFLIQTVSCFWCYLLPHWMNNAIVTIFLRPTQNYWLWIGRKLPANYNLCSIFQLGTCYLPSWKPVITIRHKNGCKSLFWMVHLWQWKPNNTKFGSIFFNLNMLLTILVIFVISGNCYHGSNNKDRNSKWNTKHRTNIFKQECIPVGCVPSTAVAISLGGWGVCPGGYLPRGCAYPGVCFPRRVSGQGGCLPGGSARHPPWTESQTGVRTLPCCNYVADGNYAKLDLTHTDLD